MLSEDAIGRHCHERTLQRARQIAASDRNILTKQVHYSRSETIVKAFVASSHGWDDRYRTSVTFDENTKEITDYACTCPAFYESDGMCKHSAALALAYLDAPERFMGYQAKRVAATSPGIAALMKRERNEAEVIDQGSIELETVIEYGYRSWSAHFRIVGGSGSYVLRSVTDFVHRMRTGEFFSYGKKLSFVHSSRMFSSQGRAIVRFLDKAVSLREQVGGSSFLRYRGRDEVERDLNLTDSELIELLDALTGTLFTVRGTDYGTRSVTQAYVVDEDPSINITIERSNMGGYDITATEDLPFAAQGDRMYVWRGDIFYRCSSTFSHTADFLRSLYESEGDGLFVNEGDMPLFCATVLPTIEQLLNVSTPPEIDDYRPVDCKLEFYFDKNKKGVTCDAQAVYGKQRYQLFTINDGGKSGSNDATAKGPLRDECLENKAKSLVEKYFDLPLPFIEIHNDAAIAELIFGGLVHFQTLGTAFTTPAFDRLLTDKQPHLVTGLSLAGNLINLTVSADDLPASEIASLLSSYRKRKRYHRLRNGSFMSLEGYDLAQLDRLVADFGITAKQLASGVVELPSYQAFYLDEQLQDSERDESFTRYLEDFRSVDENSYHVPTTLASTLRPYQEEGFRWMSALADAGFGGILADEMGLGKSVQLISFLLTRQSEARTIGPSLIVCPASLVYNWLAEFERFAPEITACAVTGTKRERELVRTKAFGGIPSEESDCDISKKSLPAKHCDVLVTSYDLARIDADSYAERTFFCCALDEAQYVKNHATKTARGIKRIQAHHRFALTGTPVENRPSELWSIFDFLLPGLLGSYMRFRERFELNILGGNEDTAERLRLLVGPFVLRRRKNEVLRELPEKLESVVRVHLEGEQQRLYAASEQHLREALTKQRRERKNKRPGSELPPVEILAELTKLRQLCCDPHLLYENYEGTAAKLDAVMELVESARDGDEKTLVFSQFTSFLTRIADRLDQQGVPYFTITGATPKKKRLDLVNTFNEDDTPVFLVSLKAGGTGLNLTGASVVIHADPWWNAAAQNQATDRAHRIGQNKLVSVHRIIAKDTIEERIVLLQEAKSQIADQIVGGSGISLSTLSKEDLLELLEG